MTNVSRAMSNQVQSIGPDATMEEANDKMRAGGYRHLPVLDGDSLVGIISDRDVALAADACSKDDQLLKNFRSQVRVRLLMSPCPIVLGPLDSLRQAIEIAVDRKISAFPVMDRGKLVGILTTTDLLRVCLGALDRGQIQLEV